MCVNDHMSPRNQAWVLWKICPNTKPSISPAPQMAVFTQALDLLVMKETLETKTLTPVRGFPSPPGSHHYAVQEQDHQKGLGQVSALRATAERQGTDIASEPLFPASLIPSPSTVFIHTSKLLLKNYLMCMVILPACMWCTTCMPGNQGSQKRVPGPLELSSGSASSTL